MGNQAIKTTLAVLAFGGSALTLFFTFYPLPPRLEAAPHEGLGQAVAQEASKLLGSGGRVFLIARDTRTFPNPAADVQIKSFSQTLKRAGVRVGSTNLVKLDPLRIVAVPTGDFFQILRRASDADVVVSFLGPAALNDEQVARLEGKAPKVIAVCTGELPRQAELKRLFDQKLLHAAVISRQNLPTAPPASGRGREWFDYLFAMVTPANLAELPAPAPDRR